MTRTEGTSSAAAGRIVVGSADGSPHSLRALKWASDEQAELTDAAKAARGSCDLGVPEEFRPLHLLVRGHHRLRGRRERVLEESISEALGTKSTAAVERAVIRGNPATRLEELSARHADDRRRQPRSRRARRPVARVGERGTSQADGRCPIVVIHSADGDEAGQPRGADPAALVGAGDQIGERCSGPWDLFGSEVADSADSSTRRLVRAGRRHTVWSPQRAPTPPNLRSTNDINHLDQTTSIVSRAGACSTTRVSSSRRSGPSATPPYGGADIGEVTSTASRIPDGDKTAWYTQWRALAERIHADADRSAAARSSLLAPGSLICAGQQLLPPVRVLSACRLVE